MQETIIQIFSYSRGMWRFRWQGLFVAWLVCLLAWALVLSLPNKYKASARVQIDTASVLKPLLKGLTAESGALNKVNMITRVMLSRPSLEKIAREADLDHEVKNEKEMELLLLELVKRISITQPFQRNSREAIIYLDIKYTDNDPVVAHKVVQMLLNTLVEDTLGENRIDTTQAQTFLMEQIANYEQQLKIAEQRLAKFKKKNMGLLPGQGGDYYARMQEALDDLVEIRVEYGLAMDRFETLKKQLEGEVLIIGDDPRILAIDDKISDYEQKRDELLLLFTEQHPDVQGMERNITQLEKKRKKVLKEQKTLSALRRNAKADDQASLKMNPVYEKVKISLHKAGVQVQSYLSKLAITEQKVEKLQQMVDTVPEVEARLTDLNRNYEVIQKQYLALLERLESAQLSENVRSSNFDIKFQVIEPPVVPVIPAGPHRLLFLLGATGAGVVSGLGLMYLLHMIFPVFIVTRELKDELGFPVLGRVSMVFSKEQLIKRQIGYYLYGTASLSIVVVFLVLVIYRESAVDLSQRLLSTYDI
ncbi:MAG: hypothetical protein GXP14_05230 [Gammaproteobacteria bacterium]|nr:hypothetical protein [Gammaproteobacteria bacterium]